MTPGARVASATGPCQSVTSNRTGQTATCCGGLPPRRASPGLHPAGWHPPSTGPGHAAPTGPACSPPLLPQLLLAAHCLASHPLHGAASKGPTCQARSSLSPQPARQGSPAQHRAREGQAGDTTQLPFMKNRQVGRGLTFLSLGSFTSPSSKSSSCKGKVVLARDAAHARHRGHHTRKDQNKMRDLPHTARDPHRHLHARTHTARDPHRHPPTKHTHPVTHTATSTHRA